MDRNGENNQVQLCGVMAGRPQYSHSSRGQEFFSFPLEIQRLSGTSDTVNVVLRQSQLAALEAEDAPRLLVRGQLRSFNNHRGEGARLVITVFARELSFTQEPDGNGVFLQGVLCKTPNLRCTPMGRDICDLMLAVNRPYGRSDYLPCICWGSRAREAARWAVGDTVELEGRIQSRPYIKLTDEGPVQKVAFEISAAEIQRLPPPETENFQGLSHQFCRSP